MICRPALSLREVVNVLKRIPIRFLISAILEVRGSIVCLEFIRLARSKLKVGKSQLQNFKQRFDQERQRLGQALEKSQAASRALAQVMPNILAMQQQYR
jgi:hypothetical protein